MNDLRTAAQRLLEACEQRLPLVGQANIIDELNALRAALAKADEDRAWVEERKANWAKDKAIAQRNALEEADRIRKAEEEGRCWACNQKTEPEQGPAGRVVSANCEYATVQWLKQTSDVGGGDPKNSRSWPIAGDTVYTAPPQRKPLTEEEISAIDWKAGETLHDFARAVERAHGIKE